MGNNKFLILLVFTSFYSFALLFANNSANNIANNIANFANKNFGSKNSLNKNAFNPLSTEANMKTLDGKKGFNVQVSCPSNDAAIKVGFVVNTNNSYSLEVQQDTNLDKNYDNIFSFTGIDGTCSNGFIKSSINGGWGTLSYYKWSATSNGRLSISPASANEVGSCQCTNSSCNYKFDKNIMDNTSGAIIVALSSAGTTRLQIGKAHSDMKRKEFNLFLQDNSKCNKVVDNGYGEKNPSKHFKTQAFGTSIADVANEQNDDKYSIYSMVNEQNKVTYSNGGTQIDIPNVKECTIRNEAILSNRSITLSENSNCKDLGTNCKIYFEEICEYFGNNCLETIFKGSNKNITVDTKVLTLQDNLNTYSVFANGSSIRYTNGSDTFTLKTGSNSWFFIKRRYTCDKIAKAVNKNPAKTVTTNVDYDNSNTFLNYKTQFGMDASINLPDAEKCIQQFCSIRKPQDTSDVFSDGTNRSQTPTSSTVYTLDYKKCTQINNKYTCPLAENEVMVEDCSCELGMAGFAQTVGAMSALEEATKDVICSQN